MAYKTHIHKTLEDCVHYFQKFMTVDEKRLVVVHLGFSKIDKVAKNNLQSLKNSVLTCITHFIAPIINKSTREANYVVKSFAT